MRPRKCLHYYHYYLHPIFGLMHIRLQTWFPFSIHVCLNGRDWLARQLDEEGIPYQQRDNCLVEIADLSRAQQLADAQLKTDWPTVLGQLARHANPAHDTLFARHPMDYYWSVEQSEWASDVLFRDPADLARLYPQLVHHGIEHLSCADVLRLSRSQGGGHFGNPFQQEDPSRRSPGQVLDQWQQHQNVRQTGPDLAYRIHAQQRE